jgi:hypothetical protein
MLVGLIQRIEGLSGKMTKLWKKREFCQQMALDLDHSSSLISSLLVHPADFSLTIS